MLLWSSSTLWQQNTSNNSTFINRVRTVRIGTAAQESLYISNFIKEAFEARTNIRTHTDSSAAKSIAMREGTSKKAKRIEVRRLFIQQLVKSKTITMREVRSEENPADILIKFVSCDTLNKHLYTVGLYTASSHSMHSMLNIFYKQSTQPPLTIVFCVMHVGHWFVTFRSLLPFTSVRHILSGTSDHGHAGRPCYIRWAHRKALRNVHLWDFTTSGVSTARRRTTSWSGASTRLLIQTMFCTSP